MSNISPIHMDLQSLLTSADDAGRVPMCFLNRHVVEVMRSNLQAQTATCVMNSFGISVNTWTKLRDGKPIRRSVAERLIGRLGRVGGYLPERQYADRGVAEFNRDPRSEEHTSELQSLMRISYAVFCLKKKNNH